MKNLLNLHSENAHQLKEPSALSPQPSALSPQPSALSKRSGKIPAQPRLRFPCMSLPFIFHYPAGN